MLKLNVAEYVPIGRLSCAGPRPPKVHDFGGLADGALKMDGELNMKP